MLLASSWVSLSGVLYQFSSLEPCARDGYALEAFCWYVPEFSTLWRPLAGLPSPGAPRLVMGAFCALVTLYLAAPVALSLLRTVRRLRLREYPALHPWDWRF